MKLLYVSPYPPSRDGIGSYTWMLENAARKAGHEVRIVVPRSMGTPPPEVMGSTAIFGRAPGQLRQALVEWKPDLVHVQFSLAAFGLRTIGLMKWVSVLRRKLQLPVLVTLHEPTRESSRLPGAASMLVRWLAAHCDRIIVHTHMACKLLIDEVGLMETKVTLMPLPKVLLHAATSSPTDLRVRYGLGDATVLLAFGFVHADKGLDDLVKAVKILRDTQPNLLENVRVVVAGEVRPRQGLFRAFEARDRLYFARTLRLARRNAVERLLLLTGYVPDGEVAGWFESAGAVVLPYRSVDQSGVAWLARSLNVPVLSSMAGGLSEQCPYSRWTFPPRAPDRIACAIADFLRTASTDRSGLRKQEAANDTATTSIFDFYGELASGSIRC